jgi:hypothetical protein
MERQEKFTDDLDSLKDKNQPSFDEYIKDIKNCDNLLDALRIKDIINTEILKKRNEIGIFIFLNMKSWLSCRRCH